jgi:hypothetical protein
MIPLTVYYASAKELQFPEPIVGVLNTACPAQHKFRSTIFFENLSPLVEILRFGDK